MDRKQRGLRNGSPCRTLKLRNVSYGKKRRVKITTSPGSADAPALKLVACLTAPSLLRKRCLVDLQFYHPSARSVCAVGAFSGGRSQAIPLEHLGGGAWLARLILPPGRYEYHFLADGEFRPDPLATEFNHGPLGEFNSVLVVE